MTLAENTEVTFFQSEHEVGFAVLRGEVRLVHGGNARLRIMSPETRIQAGRSIIRFLRSGDASIVELEAERPRCWISKARYLSLNQINVYVVQQNRLLMARTVRSGVFDLPIFAWHLPFRLHQPSNFQPPPTVLVSLVHR